MAWVEQVLSYLSAQGHRVTAPRRTILELMAQYNHPFSAEELFKDAGGEQGPIGRATVYRTVELLYDDHWFARVHLSSARSSTTPDDHAYVPIEQRHQHHLICRKCGAATAFEGCDIDVLVGGLAKRLNFRVDGHWLEIYGLCQVCQRQV